MNSKEYIISGNIEAYVLGLCTPEEKAEAEAMRLQYPEVNEAIVAFEKALEKEFTGNPSPTSTALDATILQSLNALGTPVIPIAPAPVKRSNWFKMAAAAAVVLLIGSSILNYTLYNKTKAQELALETKQNEAASLPIADYSVLKNPAITPVAMNGVGIHAICRCTMFWDKKTGKAYIMIHHLVPSSPGNNYQLWATVNGQPVSIGLINDKIRDRFIEMPNVPNDASGFSVTLEKAGGSSSPTESETYLVGRI